MKIKIKLLILIILCISIFSFRLLFSESPIYLVPIEKTFVYNNFFDSLYPFMYSTKIIKVDKNSLLKLLDEIDYENGFYGDILKVEVVKGYNKGKIGYILEEDVCLSHESIKNNISVFFENDIVVDNQNKILKGTRCSIINSIIELGEEVLTLKFLSSSLNNLTLKYTKKNNIHFIINKESEILYHLRKNNKIVKIVNPNTLLPIENAVYNNVRSDKYGILYIDNNLNSKINLIKKHGYTKGIIISNHKDENVHLCFIEQLDYINYYDDRETIYKNDIFNFIINNKNKSISNKIGIKILSKNSLSIFGYPDIKKYNINIEGGFYIENLPEFTNTICRINSNNDRLELKYFNIDKIEWENVNIKKNKNYLSLELSKDGYYLLFSKSKSNESKIKISENNNLNYSNIYFKNKEGNNYFTCNKKSNEIIIPEGSYEALWFSINSPYNLFQKLFYFNSQISNLNFNDIIKTDTSKNILKGFSELYNGDWYRKNIKVNGKNTNFENKVEHLGDMKLNSINKIAFISDDYIFEGFIEIIDNQKLFIHIIYINTPILDQNLNYNFLINPSIFNSQLIIPAFYSFKVGILQISFNNIYFSRKKISNDSTNNKLLILESNIMGYIKFPNSEQESFYKIYFMQ